MGVIALAIGVIAWLALNSLGYAQNASAKNRAIVTMSKMREAIQKYKEIKNTLPGTLGKEAEYAETKGAFMVAILEKVEPNLPDSHLYFEMPVGFEPKEEAPMQNEKGEWQLLDAWRHPYRLHLDLNGDGKIPHPAKGTGTPEPMLIPPGFIMYSAGPDGDYATWDDNVRSW